MNRVALICGSLLAVCLLTALAGWQGYRAGYEKAEVEGRAALAELKSDHDTAYAAAMASVNEKLQTQTRNALAVSKTLETERINHAKEQADLRARIASVTRNSRHTFSSDFVRLWNEAIGAHAPAARDAVSAAGGPPGAHGTAGAGQAAGTGLLASVTEADVLAFIAYYGERARNLEARVNAWINLVEGWK